MTMGRAYLDHNATTPLRPEAAAAMRAAMDACGNPSSVHAEGRRVRAMIDTAREQVAALVGAKPAEVVFTSGATEANNWVIRAGWDAILSADIEHDSVRAPVAASPAAKLVVPVTREGGVEVADIARSVNADGRTSGRRSLLALQLANNETGVIQPVADVARFCRDNDIAVHCDAVQAAGKIDLDFAALGVDAMSLSAHKLGGPAGVGALVIRDGFALPGLIAGGGQERRRRSGTENAIGIAGFGAAAAVTADRAAWSRIETLRDRLEAGIVRLTPEAIIVGYGAARLPNTTTVALPGRIAERLVIRLDLAGIAVSAGAACSSGKVSESHVLKAMGYPPALAASAIRVSLGWTTSETEIDAFLRHWGAIAGGGVSRAA